MVFILAAAMASSLGACGTGSGTSGENADVGGGRSITFANYIDGTTGAVRNMDLQRSDYCSYQLMIQPGDNAKHQKKAQG